jgi:hypothetical protein
MLATFALLLQIAIGNPRSAELLDDPVVRSFSRVLARDAMGDRYREHGAFVVRTADGLLYFVAWPPSGERYILRWYGRFPDGTIAILHTHEASLPEASHLDMKAARAAGIPIYVITPAQIAKTTGDRSQVVIAGDWLTSSR